MISDRFGKFSMQRERDADANATDTSTSVSLMDSVVSKLRGTDTDDLGKSWKKQSKYWYKYWGYAGLTCRWCGHPDDDEDYLNEYETIEEQLTMSRSLVDTDEFHTSNQCSLQIQNCAPESPNDSEAGQDGADNYIVSDLRKSLADEDEGLIFTLETVEHQVATQSLLTE
ncbi:MAG: hypothetical protein SGARI_002730 [Bacillariaceae sp.]